MKTHNLTRLLLLTTLLLPFSKIATADEVERLEQEALLYLQAHYKNIAPDARTEIKLNPISRKIKLKSCLSPFEFQTPRGSGSRITFRAKCPSPMWQLFVVAEIKQYALAVVSSTSLPKRKVLTAQDLQLREVDITSLRAAYFKQISDVVGATVKRTVSADTIISATMLTPALAVAQGNAVIIEAVRNKVVIRTNGTALEDGARGDQIRVQNDRSGNTVKATIIQPGLVRVP